MSVTQLTKSSLPCTWGPQEACQRCSIRGQLMCRFRWSDLADFFLHVLPFLIAAMAGVIRAGYGRWLWAWLAYALFFFFVWEARVLCSHCPYWAGEGRVLRCHANYGVVKLWRYRPGPMSRGEQAQFVIGALLLVGFPFPFLLLGGEHLLAAIGLAAAVSAAFHVWRHTCCRCIHFSCPANHVPKEMVDAYLERNPEMRAAWVASGYRLGE